jgi:hypothetical protein
MYYFLLKPNHFILPDKRKATFVSSITGRNVPDHRRNRLLSVMLLPFGLSLTSQAKLFNQSAVPFHVFVLQVRQQLTALTYHLEQAAAGVVVLLVLP